MKTKSRNCKCICTYNEICICDCECKSHKEIHLDKAFNDKQKKKKLFMDKGLEKHYWPPKQDKLSGEDIDKILGV